MGAGRDVPRARCGRRSSRRRVDRATTRADPGRRATHVGDRDAAEPGRPRRAARRAARRVRAVVPAPLRRAERGVHVATADQQRARLARGPPPRPGRRRERTTSGVVGRGRPARPTPRPGGSSRRVGRARRHGAVGHDAAERAAGDRRGRRRGSPRPGPRRPPGGRGRSPASSCARSRRPSARRRRRPRRGRARPSSRGRRRRSRRRAVGAAPARPPARRRRGPRWWRRPGAIARRAAAFGNHGGAGGSGLRCSYTNVDSSPASTGASTPSSQPRRRHSATSRSHSWKMLASIAPDAVNAQLGGLVAAEVDVPALGEDVDDPVELPPERPADDRRRGGRGRPSSRSSRSACPAARMRSRRSGSSSTGCTPRCPPPPCPAAAPPGPPRRGGRSSARARRLATSRR